MGITLGNVLHFNSNKGHIKIKLEDKIEIGDQIQINNNSYTVSEIMDKNKNLKDTFPRTNCNLRKNERSNKRKRYSL